MSSAPPSSLQEAGLSFAISHDPQQVRLIELPPALLQEVESKSCHLELKTSTGDAGGLAVLCSASQTFSVRQNQSSNSLFLTSVLPPPSSLASSASASSTPPHHGDLPTLHAFAQPRGMLEITPSKPDALGHLTRTVPRMTLSMATSADATSSSSMDMEPQRRSRAAWTDGAPFSRGEFGDAALAACAFEHGGALWLPEPDLLAAAWAVARDGMARSGESGGERWIVDLDGRELADCGLPRGVVVAVARRAGVVQERDAGNGDESGKVAISPEKVAPWLGDVLLGREAARGGGVVGREAFLETWTEAMPSAWRGRATMDAITTRHSVAEDGTVRVGVGGAGEGAADAATKAAAVAPKKVNKWHERLGASRR